MKIHASNYDITASCEFNLTWTKLLTPGHENTNQAPIVYQILVNDWCFLLIMQRIQFSLVY